MQIETDHLSYAGSPGQISQQQGTKVDADLSVAEQEALLGWLNDVEGEVGNEGTEDDAAALRRRLSRRPRRAARGDQAPPGGAARAGAADRRVERAGRRPGRPGRRARADGAGGVAAPARALAARRADAQAARLGVGADRLRPHHAPQHALRRHPVLAGDGAARGGQAAPGGAHRRLAVRARDGPLHPAPRPRPAEPVRPGADVRVRRGAAGDHRPVRGPPRRARARPGVRRGRARRRRELRLRRGVRGVPRGLLVGRHPADDGAGARRRARERQRPEPARVRGDHPPGPGDDLADARAALLVGARGPATCRCTPSTAAGCGWCAT